jgi:hypothetical protein
MATKRVDTKIYKFLRKINLKKIKKYFDSSNFCNKMKNSQCPRLQTSPHKKHKID